MTERKIPTRVRGTVGPKVLAKSAELFDQNLSTVFRELFQNARRAGATTIDLTIVPQASGSLITMTDNGPGISDPQILLTFGGSNWDEHLDAAENAAGMGFFSIASRGATVRSCGWRMTLTPAVFRGTEEAAVLTEINPVTGTQIEFSARDGENPANAISDAARHLPLKVTLNGRREHQVPFLDGAVAISPYAGINIGVVIGRSTYISRPKFNFHGVTARSKERPFIVERNGTCYEILFDIVEAPDLKLVLPTRHAVVEDDFFERLMIEGRKAVYRHIASNFHNFLPYKETLEARSLGIDMPDPVIILRGWIATDNIPHKDKFIGGAQTEETTDIHMLVDSFDAPLKATFHEMTKRTGTETNFYKPDDAYDGHPLYDIIPLITAIRCDVTLENGTTFSIRLDGESDEENEAIIQAAVDGLPPDRIVAKSIIAKALIDGPDDQVAFETPIPFLFYGEELDLYEASFIVARDAKVHEFAEGLKLAFWTESDDASADSYDTQSENATADALEIARKALLTEDLAAVQAIRDKLADLSWSLRAANIESIDIVKAPTDDPNFSFFKARVKLDNGFEAEVNLH